LKTIGKKIALQMFQKIFSANEINTSLKSPTRGMWFLRDLPITLPVFEMTTAVFQMTSPRSSVSLSSMGLTMTML
jgi:hypothetical protein